MKQLFGDILRIENKNSIIIFPTFTSETLLASVNNYVQEIHINEWITITKSLDDIVGT